MPFSTSMHIRVTDLNYGGHIGNDRILGMVHEARVRYLKQLGMTELDACGVGMLMAESIIQYKAEGFLGDRVQIEVGAGDFGGSSWNFYYRLHLSEKDLTLALARTTMVAFDYASRKLVPVPDRLRKMLLEGM